MKWTICLSYIGLSLANFLFIFLLIINSFYSPGLPASSKTMTVIWCLVFLWSLPPFYLVIRMRREL
jgi:hypothetical protein